MKFYILIFVMFPTALFCQTISGSIVNSRNEKILFAHIVTKDSINSVTNKEFTIARNGEYLLRLTKQYKKLVIEISASKYQKEIFVIDSISAESNYTRNVVLVKDTIIKLQDVEVKAKVRPFQIKGDTVSYNVSAYKDGTERKIQDLIKKLPGIEVNEKTGEIRYKGRSVETVKLDGENLFSSNYTIGTKNINVDMVEQVQAIENYSDNPLLKGIESGDKVALNLTLKKNKADYSGSLDIGLGKLGTKAAIENSSNILGISKRYKSFATVSFNNVGINNTPFDYFSYNPNIDQLKDDDLLAKKYISETYFNTGIDSKRSNINNSFFGSYNAILKMGNKLSLKSNIYHLNDKITFQQSYIATNLINGQELTTSDKNSIIKKPTQIRGDVEVIFNVSKKSLVEYSALFKKEIIKTSDDVLQNNITFFTTSLNTTDEYFKQAFTYTSKLSEKQALQIVAIHTYNNLPQQLILTPAVFEPSKYNHNIQTSWYKKSNLMVQSTFLGSNSKGKYTFTFGSNYKDIEFNSGLIGENDTINETISDFQNLSTYKQKNIFATGGYRFQFKHFKLSPAIKISYLQQSLSDKSLLKNRDTSCYLVEPGYSVLYKMNNYSGLLLSMAIKKKPFTEDYFVEKPVYISNRTIKSNEVSLQIQQSKTIGIFYLVNNLYKQFQLNVGVSYSENKGNYFSSLVIQQNSTEGVNFFLPENSNILSLNFMAEKFLSILQGTVRIKNDYSKQLYKNIINNSALRNNTTEAFISTLFFKTAMDGKINFENTVIHRFFKSGTEGGLSFTNQSIDNNFQLIIRPAKKLFLSISTNYYLPTIDKKPSYFFFDNDITYQTKNKVYDFRLKARNITNNRTFREIQVNDYSRYYFQSKLLQSHFVMSISRSF